MERSRDAYSRGFLSTLSLRRATSNLASDPPTIGISIHALLAESDITNHPYCGDYGISIHALLAESDNSKCPCLPGYIHFYPRSPCGERHTHPIGILITVIFLSTLSLRRATSVVDSCSVCSSISIHALLAESDTPITFRHCTTYLFLSTLSLRRATARNTSIAGRITSFLSTLSLRRATKDYRQYQPKRHNFYPRSPCGERLFLQNQFFIHHNLFLSTLSLRRATACFVIAGTASAFLSTLSLRRATSPDGSSGRQEEFLSTLSLRRATISSKTAEIARTSFLSTLSLRRATGFFPTLEGRKKLFLSTLSLRRAT